MSAIIESILISSDGIKNSLKKYKPLQALAEYVWNGFDAHANRIDICISNNVLNGTDCISITDNGEGIDRTCLQQKFKPFFQSEKVYDPNIKHSTTHGKNGVGRLTFYTFANLAKWETSYCKNGKVYSYKIDISEATLENYVPSEEQISSDSTGTKVVFIDVTSSEISPDTVEPYLAHEFCWFLELNKDKDYSIYINGKKLDYNDSILFMETVSYTHEDTKISYDVRYVCWNIKLTEYSKYYYLKAGGTEIAKENTTLNNKGDHFFHSVYIQSRLFDNFSIENIGMHQMTMGGMGHKKSPAYEFIMKEVNRHLYDIRRPFIKKSVSKIVDGLEISSAFPSYDPNNVVDQYRKNQITDMISTIYIAQPKIFTGSMNKEQKKTFIRLLDLIMESGEVNSLFEILNEVLDMTEIERHDLADILKYAHMSNITRTIKLIRDRYQAVEDLKQLVFNPDLNADEVHHLQEFIERHYWLFGEQYNLVTAAEPNFVEALKRELKYLHKEYEDAAVEHPDKLKQMDIFAVRKDVSHGKYNNIVLELKHPNIALGETQLSQVKRYMSVIMGNDQFNAANMTWEFYLVGNKFSSTGFIKNEIETNKMHGEPFLVFNMPRYKIYVIKWSEVIANFEMRYSYLNSKLELEQQKLQNMYTSANEVISQQNLNTAVMPGEMQSSKV